MIGYIIAVVFGMVIGFVFATLFWRVNKEKQKELEDQIESLKWRLIAAKESKLTPVTTATPEQPTRIEPQVPQTGSDK